MRTCAYHTRGFRSNDQCTLASFARISSTTRAPHTHVPLVNFRAISFAELILHKKIDMICYIKKKKLACAYYINILNFLRIPVSAIHSIAHC